jgi:hypothetical protein
MTTNHIFYIPIVLLVGLILGAILGRKSVEAAADEDERLRERREARRRSSLAHEPTAPVLENDAVESEVDEPGS